jgi:hypothetical protein
MTSVIAVTRSPLQAAILRPICGLYLQGEGVLLGASNEDSYSGSSISSLMVVERKSRFRDDESASYVVPDDVTADIFSSVHMRFGLVPKRWILRYVQCFGGGRWIQHKDRTSALAFEERHWEEDDGRIWIAYSVFFISDFFHV